VDIGAHTGEFTQAVRRFCGIKEALLIEAQPSRAAELRHTFPATNFYIVNAALAHQAGTVDLEINEFDATTSILKIRRQAPELNGLDLTVRETVACETHTLDEVAVAMRGEHIDLMKIDVQGAELLVIRGGGQTLAKTQRVWCEVSFRPLYDESCVFSDIYDALWRRGFFLAEIEPGFRSPGGELLQADALFLRRDSQKS